MANPEHLAMLKDGKEKWNQWRENNRDITVDLSNAELHNADLCGFDFSGADFIWTKLQYSKLINSNFSEAALDRTNFFGCDLSKADFTYTISSNTDFKQSILNDANFKFAHLIAADFSHANLSEVDFHGATFIYANFYEAHLSRTNFKDTTLDEVLFIDVNLSETINLDYCSYQSPSVIDFRTIERSGSLPLSFLRGCGLSDTLIDYLPSLLNQPIQFYSCFISYSSKDDDFAKRLYADLQNNRVRCWFAPEDMKGGRKLHEQIGDAIRLHEKLLLILSEHSMNSEWVKTEIAKARQREVKQKHQVLFPVSLVPFEKIQQWECFDADTGKDSAKEIREFYIPDFSNWKNHDAYQAAFDRLLKDLKPELERKPES